MKDIKYGKSGGEIIELCPICGYENTHVGEITFPKKEAIPENENDDLRRVADVRIYFWGECDHHWIKEWHSYKGHTFVAVYVIKEERII